MDDETTAPPEPDAPEAAAPPGAGPEPTQSGDASSSSRTVEVELDGDGVGQAVVDDLVAFDVVDASAGDGSTVTWNCGPTVEQTIVVVRSERTTSAAVSVTLEIAKGGE